MLGQLTGRGTETQSGDRALLAGVPDVGPGLGVQVHDRQPGGPVRVLDQGGRSTARGRQRPGQPGGQQRPERLRCPIQQRDRGDSVADPADQQAARVQHGVRLLAEHPLGGGVLRGLGPQGCGDAVAVGVEVPPAGAVGHEDELIARGPAGVDGGLGRTAGHVHHVDHRALDETPATDPGRVPGHGRVVPLGPGQPVGVGQLGVGVEVGAGAEHAADPLAAQLQSDDGGDRLAVAGVVLAHGEHQTTLGVHAQIGVPVIAHRGEGCGATVLHAVEAVVREVGEHHDPVTDGVSPAAVLVHPAADVVRVGGHRLRRAVDGRPHELDPPALVRPGLEPVERVAVELR